MLSIHNPADNRVTCFPGILGQDIAYAESRCPNHSGLCVYQATRDEMGKVIGVACAGSFPLNSPIAACDCPEEHEDDCSHKDAPHAVLGQEKPQETVLDLFK